MCPNCDKGLLPAGSGQFYCPSIKHIEQLANELQKLHPASIPSLDEVLNKHCGELGWEDCDFIRAKQAILEYNASLVAEVERLAERVKSEEARANGLGNRIAKEKAEADCKRISKERDELRKLADKLHEANHEVVAERNQLRTQLSTAERTGYERGVRDAAYKLKSGGMRMVNSYTEAEAILNLLNKKD